MSKIIIKTAEQIQQEYIIAKEQELTSFVQSLLDQKAQERSYDHAERAISYIGDPNPKFDAEARAIKNWRSAVWTRSYELLDEVKSGQRPIPTPEELVELLPAFTWPNEE